MWLPTAIVMAMCAVALAAPREKRGATGVCGAAAPCGNGGTCKVDGSCLCVNEFGGDLCEYACDKVDVTFALDSSDGTDWGDTKDFAASVAEKFIIGPDNVQFGLINFGAVLDRVKDLSESATFLSTLPSVQRLGGNREYISNALDEAFHGYDASRGDRADATDVFIVVTNANSDDDPADWARTLTLAGVDCILVAIDNRVRDDEFPTFTRFSVDRYSRLNRLVTQVRDRICAAGGVKHCDSNPCQNGGLCVNQANGYRCECSQDYAGVNCDIACGPMDIGLVLDASKTLDATSNAANWLANIIPFVHLLIEKLPLGGDFGARLGSVTFSTNCEVDWFMDTFTDSAEYLANIDPLLNYLNSKTNTACGLGLVRTNVFDSPANRDKINDITLVFTDGNPDRDTALTIPQATNLKNFGDNMQVFVMGVIVDPDVVNRGLMIDIATSSSAAFFARHYDAMSVYVDSIKAGMCQASSRPCDTLPCMNGGVCSDDLRSYTCTCPPGTSGVNCEEFKECWLYDVCFVLDESVDVEIANWPTMLQFANDVIDQLVISPEDVRVGVVRYGTTAVNDVTLAQYTTAVDLQSAVSALPYGQAPASNTHLGLATLKDACFSAASGDRADRPNVAILVSDTRSADPVLTLAMAEDARVAGIDLIAVGVGYYSDTELYNVVGGDTTNLFFSRDFNLLPDLAPLVVAEMCDERTTSACDSIPCPSGATCVTSTDPEGYTCICPPHLTGDNCDTQFCDLLDICFLMDSSATIGLNWPAMTGFINDVIDPRNITSDRVHAGVAQFSWETRMEVFLDQYPNDKVALQSAVSAMRHLKQTSETALGMDLMMSQCFDLLRGDRSDADNTAVVVTDGPSQYPADTSISAANVRDAGVDLFVVGVQDYSLREVSDWVDGNSTRAFVADSYSELPNVAAKVTASMCMLPIPGGDPCESYPCLNGGTCVIKSTGATTNTYVCACPPGYTGQSCETFNECYMMDLCFTVDSSATISLADWNMMLEWMKIFVRNTYVTVEDVQIGVVKFSYGASLEIKLNDHATWSTLETALEVLVHDRRSTFTHQGLEMTRTACLSAANGDRAGHENVVLLVTDGPTDVQQGPAAIAQGAMLRDAGAKVFAVGVDGYAIDELLALTGSRDHVMVAGSYGELNEAFFDNMMEAICGIPKTNDGCASSPCLNGGVCVSAAGGGFVCACSPLFSGPTCSDPPPLPIPSPNCAAGTSICFVVDNSANTRNNVYEKAAVVKMMRHQNVGLGKVEVGAYLYAWQLSNLGFSVGTHRSLSWVVAGFSGLGFMSTGNTLYVSALRNMRTLCFGDAATGNRKVGIFLGDGPPEDVTTQLAAEIGLTVGAGIEMFAIGVPGNADSATMKTHLLQVVSGHEDHVKMAASWAAIDDAFIEDFMSTVCT